MSLCKQRGVPSNYKLRTSHYTQYALDKRKHPFRKLICFPHFVSKAWQIASSFKPKTSKRIIALEEAGFITLSTLYVSFICFLLIGYITYEVHNYSLQNGSYEQTAYADLLAQDAMELAKQQLAQNPAWQGLSSRVQRPNGSCQYKIQKNVQTPISPSIRTLYPNGLFIEATGRTTEGSTRVIDLWYIPSTQKTVAFEYV